MQSTNRNVKKVTLCALLMLSLTLSCLALTGCGGEKRLSGKYKSESGKYEVRFERNGECTWYQDKTFFEGTYYWDNDEDVYVLEIVGSGFYSSTVFEAEPQGNGLVVNGGLVRDEFFKKK